MVLNFFFWGGVVLVVCMLFVVVGFLLLLFRCFQGPYPVVLGVIPVLSSVITPKRVWGLYRVLGIEPRMRCAR